MPAAGLVQAAAGFVEAAQKAGEGADRRGRVGFAGAGGMPNFNGATDHFAGHGVSAFPLVRSSAFTRSCPVKRRLKGGTPNASGPLGTSAAA